MRRITGRATDGASIPPMIGRLDRGLRPGGYLVIGSHERLPGHAPGYARLDHLPIYRKQGQGE